MNSMSIEMALYRTGLGAMPRGLSLLPRLDASARRPYLNSCRGLSRKSLISTINADISQLCSLQNGRREKETWKTAEEVPFRQSRGQPRLELDADWRRQKSGLRHQQQKRKPPCGIAERRFKTLTDAVGFVMNLAL